VRLGVALVDLLPLWPSSSSSSLPSSPSSPRTSVPATRSSSSPPSPPSSGATTRPPGGDFLRRPPLARIAVVLLVVVVLVLVLALTMPLATPPRLLPPRRSGGRRTATADDVGGGTNADAVGARGTVNDAAIANHHAMDCGTVPGSRVRRPRRRLVMVCKSRRGCLVWLGRWTESQKLGNTILVKLKLWELDIVFNKTFWSATNLCLRYASAKCGR
jgi:hypothetical protein